MDCGDLSDEELEVLDQLERLYAEIHYSESTQQNDGQDNQNHSIASSAPPDTTKGTLRRYWHNGNDRASVNTPFQKLNLQKLNSTPKNTPVTKNNITPTRQTKSNVETIGKPKEERPSPPKQSVTSDLVSFGSPLAKDTRTTIKIIENDDIPCMDLDTSDEDEVIEVVLPPKPTITVESSDEDEISVVTPQEPPKTVEPSKDDHGRKRQAEAERREVSASPVPSVVSSVSDEFIRGDCIALNISSRRPDNPSFDFSLHGSDLLVAPSKRKKKKKNKDRDKSLTPVASLDNIAEKENNDLFATPKNKAKNKKQKAKNSAVIEKNIPIPDIYDSDSNQSFDTNKKPNYAVTEKSLPSADVYESDSSQSEVIKTPNKPIQKKLDYHEVESTVSTVILSGKKTQEIPLKTTPKSPNLTSNAKNQKDQQNTNLNTSVVDLTDDLDDTFILEDEIEENIVMANVTGFEESDDYGDNDNTSLKDPSKVGSTKVPAILFCDLDFDNLKRNEKVCKKQLYSPSMLRTEMDKFYNESWGGEDFNHRDIQKTMSRDKSLWEIDPKDRLPTPFKRKITCNYCHRAGHRTDTCRMRPPICHMCGETGHHEPRCPYKICVNCGASNFMYSTICRNCSSWGPMSCAECHQQGHPASHCPDYWRRYHNTIENHATLVKNPGPRKKNELFCSGCAGHGHLIHTCRFTIPFSGLPINTPYVVNYKPTFPPPYAYIDHVTDENDKSLQNKTLKRHSKSPVHETHVSKKRHLSAGDADKQINRQNDKQLSDNSPQPMRTSTPHRVRTQTESTAQKNVTNSNSPNYNVEKAADYIAVTSTNHDKKGQIIQDNEVSDTSEVVTTSRIYLSSEVRDRLKSKEGQEWLKATAQEHSVETSLAESDLYMNIKGMLAGQEGFQAKLRGWIVPTDNKNTQTPQEPNDSDQLSNNIPRNRNELLRKLSSALGSLKEYLGDPKELFKELQYHQRNHHSLLKQKVLSVPKLRNSSKHIDEMLKKLNMVLLGQAGLADGILHLNELYSLREQLTNKRTKKISLKLRKEIGEHFQCIFMPVPRTDYVELLREYYSPDGNLMGHKKKNVPIQRPIQQIQGMVFQPEPPKPNSLLAITVRKPKNFLRRPENIVNKLRNYHRMLVAYDKNQKKRQGMARKLHIQISSALKNEALSKSAKKKIMRLQEEANMFLK